MADRVIEVAPEKRNITATTTITAPRSFMGVFVSQASATPTLRVSDTGGNIINTLTPEAGRLYMCPCVVTGDLTITIGGTVDCTVLLER